VVAAIFSAVVFLPGDAAFEELFGAGIEIDDVGDGVVGGGAVGGEEASAATGIVEVAELVFQGAFGELQAEMFTGDVFDGVGFVEDGQVVLGEIIDAGDAEGQVGEEEGVVDDEEIAALHALFGGLPEAVFEVGAFFAQAIVVFGADFVPDAGFGDGREIGEGAVGGVGGPLFDLPEGIDLFFVFEECVLALSGLFEAALAEVIAAAFDEDGGEFIGVDGLEERDVLVDELFLEGDGVGGDDDAFFVFDGEVDGGQEIGEGFADAGAGLDEEMMVLGEGFLDGGGHLQLLGTEFELVSESSGDDAAGGEDVVEGGAHGGIVGGELSCHKCNRCLATETLRHREFIFATDEHG
jgi:hypothetical protein